mmetsp:Transcript_29048/g.42831  ORF Transcript_29048/g.42831 Transcript_29048/m.42831 type:complete len:259 (+) Transcript_29048:498-1274(+)
MASFIAFVISDRIHGTRVNSPPITRTSSPILGGLGRDTSMAVHPGSFVVSLVTITRTGPSKRRLRTETGNLALTFVVTSISALRLESHRIWKSNPKSSGPKSKRRASSRRGAASPVLKLRNVSFLTFGRDLAFFPAVASSSESRNAASIGAVSVSGIIRSSAYCKGIRPGNPTAPAYKLASSFTASTPSTACLLASANPSIKVIQAALNRPFKPSNDRSLPINTSRLAIKDIPTDSKIRRRKIRAIRSARRQLSRPKA